MAIIPNKNIFDSVIKQDLCIGCGACFYPTQQGNLKMEWNKEGFLIPTSDQPQTITEDSLKVCPFNPFPDDEVRTENEISNLFLQDATRKHPRIGRYTSTYVGYSNKYRLTSSSGGVATYLVEKLLRDDIVDAVVTVKEGKDTFYEYSVIRSTDELLASSKTRYYPVSFSTVIEVLKNSDERFAIVGIACFIKSVRLLQHYHPELRDKIKFTIGIICGGIKSRFFAEYLAGKSGVENEVFKRPEFRIKDFESTASDYSFGCTDQRGKDHTIKMKKVGDMWGSGMFKNNACDFCDDVTTELADISLGDAWLNPYNQDGRGTNVVVTRSQLADDIIKKGIVSAELNMNTMPLNQFLFSQQGSFNHRQKALGYRINLVNKKGLIIPPKRHSNEKISFIFKLVQNQRRIVRKKSLIQWPLAKDTAEFDQVLLSSKERLKRRTRINHLLRLIRKKIRL